MFTGTILGLPALAVYALGGLAATVAAFVHSEVALGEKIANGKLASKSDYEEIKGDDGVVVAKDLQLSFDSSKEGVLVVGPTGAGKTTGVIFPTLLKLFKRENVIIVTDPKEELYEAMKGLLEFSGKEVYRFHLTNPRKSHRFDPIAFCKDEEEVGQLAQNIILNGRKAIENETGKVSNDSDWLSMATPLLKAYLLLLWSGNFKAIYSGEGKINHVLSVPNTLPRLLEFIVSAPEDTLKYTILNNHYEPAIIQYGIYYKSLKSSGTNSSILSVLSDCVNTLMTNTHLRKIMNGNDLNPETIRKKEKIIFIQYPEEEANYYAPFTSILFKQLMNKVKLFNENEVDKKLPTFFLVDELANIGIIPSFSNFITTCRSKDISFTGAIQSVSQLKKIYGEYDSDTIVDNLKTKVIFPGVGKDSEIVSKRAGDKQIKIKDQIYRKEVIEASSVTHLEKGKVVIISDNKEPLIVSGEKKIPKHYIGTFFLEEENEW